ncbi:hypothetical protein ACOSQ4_031088 [Xanthoceras sorbifolium]
MDGSLQKYKARLQKLIKEADTVSYESKKIISCRTFFPRGNIDTHLCYICKYDMDTFAKTKLSLYFDQYINWLSSNCTSSVSQQKRGNTISKLMTKSTKKLLDFIAMSYAATINFFFLYRLLLLLFDNLRLFVVLDGYSAPLAAGNYAKLVIDGAYDGARLSCIDQAVLTDNGLDKKGYAIPLEIMPSGQFEPLYRTTLSVQDEELPVLPLSVYEAIAMAHSEDSEEYSAPYQFFFYLYDKRNSKMILLFFVNIVICIVILLVLQAGLGGLSFDEGQFSVFGYTAIGREILPQIKTGDVIRSAKLIQGQDRLILPNEN